MKLFLGTSDLNNFEPKCKCGSKNLEQVNESVDGFYIDFKCDDCDNHVIF